VGAGLNLEAAPEEEEDKDATELLTVVEVAALNFPP